MKFFLLLYVVIAAQCFALDPARTLFQYNCRTWARQNGLPANGVSAIAQTRDGYIWLGSAQGLISFDGVEFRLMDMSRFGSPIVTSLSACKQGGLWFGLERSAFGYCDGKNISFRGNDRLGGVTLNVQSLLESRNGDLYLAAESQLGCVTRDKTYNIVLPQPGGVKFMDATAVYEDSKGRIWMGTAHQGMYYLEHGTVKQFPDPILDNLEVRCVAEDTMGQIWIGTDLGPLCYDSNLQRKPFPFPWYPTRALLVDRKGTLWLGTISAGLARYQNGNLTYLRKQDGLAEDVVVALAEDKEGSLWVGTRGGLSQLTDVKIPTFGKSEGLSADVNTDVCASKRGGLWIATGDGFTYFDQKEGMIHSVSLGLTNNYVQRIFEAQSGDICLVNGYKDIELFSGDKLLARYASEKWPSAIAEDKHGLVVARDGELFRIGTHSLVPYRFADGQKPDMGWIFNLATARDGSLLMACTAGICRVKSDGTFTLWTREDGLPTSNVTWVCEDPDGVIWAGTESGIAMLENGRIRVITRENGLFDNITYAIVPDDRGNLWVDSSRGFYRVSRQGLRDFAAGRTHRVECVAFNGVDGVKNAERFQQQFSGCKTLDGRIWFPTAHGIVMIDPAHIAKNSVPPQVFIQSARANGRELNTAEKAVIEPGKGELEFHYTGLSYISPLAIGYRYKLEGYDQNWVEAGNRRSMLYTNLKPGEYRFLVQACNEDGVWNTEAAAFSLKLLPHFYETAWFIVLVLSILGVGIGGLYRWRLKQLERKQKQLQAARDLLEAKVEERTAQLTREIKERERVQLEVERVHRELVDASRQAGQAEVASNVLHNVGNVLNSVNISATMIKDRVEASKSSGVNRVTELLSSHRQNLTEFLAENGRIDQVINYLECLGQSVASERSAMLVELEDLTKNIDHIKEIVAMQQNYAQVSGVMESQSVPALVEDALRIHENALANCRIRVMRKFDPAPNILADRHKILQILVNLIANAKHALTESTAKERLLTLTVGTAGEDTIRVAVTDNGIGIPKENLTRIFTHGFTTRPDGHGFGLHSGALAAKEMGGNLSVHSEGRGQGATFTLELPLQKKLVENQ
jgi:ligand-binding sensor domain-containing protein/two-component sensor histidine kinase